jgi:hypothetical protein
MIKTVLFVHGTGVRHASYVETSARVASALSDMKLDLSLRPCAWGDEHGANIDAYKGASIPDYEGPEPAVPLNEAQMIALWEVLVHDPLFELRERAAVAPGFVQPAEKARKAKYLQDLQELATRPELLSVLQGHAVSMQWPEAVSEVVGTKPLQVALAAAPALDADLRIATARAVVATLQQRLEDANMPQLGQPLRDKLVELSVNHTGGYALGVKDWLKDRLIGLGLRWATNKAKRERDALYNAAFPAAGDILLYQARGKPIRRYIAQRIAECEGNVAVLAHSLGGIACVDLLAALPHPQVRLLVTVGSQAPLLYEIDALTNLRRGKALPEHFPPSWLNFYDPNDLLSYCAAPIFKPRATDHKIVSGQPFPYSHSAYWEMPTLWETLKSALAA